MKTDRNAHCFWRPRSRRPIALGLVALFAVLQVFLSRDAASTPTDARSEAAFVVGSDGVCAPATGKAPLGRDHAPAGACCVSSDCPKFAPPAPERAGAASRLSSRRLSRREGHSLRLVLAASGWRSSWSAQAPPLAS